jgi:ribosomal protein S21
MAVHAIKKGEESNDRLQSRFKKQVQEARFIKVLRERKVRKKKLTKRLQRIRALKREGFRAQNKKKRDDVEPPTEYLAGAVVYARPQGTDDIYLALVHDVFGRWTLSKGHIEGKDPEKEIAKAIKDELSLDVEVKDKLGVNEYSTYHPEKGKIKKNVTYFLCESPFVEIGLKETGGLDDAKWFKMGDILDLNFYNDILPLVTKAINILLKK